MWLFVPITLICTNKGKMIILDIFARSCYPKDKEKTTKIRSSTALKRSKEKLRQRSRRGLGR